MDDNAEIREALREVARSMLARDRAPTSEDEFVAGLDEQWKRFADAGWLGLEVPEFLGGAGVSFAEVAVVLEEMGRALTPGPYVPCAVLSVGALLFLDESPERDRVLRAIAEGESVATTAFLAEHGDATPEVPFRAEKTAGGTSISGRSTGVLGACEAQIVLLVAAGPSGEALLGIAESGAAGLAVEEQPSLDSTRRLGTIVADGLVLDDASVKEFGFDQGRVVAELVSRGALALSCDSLGMSEAMLEATVEYAKVRQQFGRAIGSFQAVKHGCADVQVDNAIARALLDDAIEQAVVEGSDALAEASMVKAFVGERSVRAVGKAMQYHGGFGYTWESGIHWYLKRALLNRAMFGSPLQHRLKLAERYESLRVTA